MEAKKSKRFFHNIIFFFLFIFADEVIAFSSPSFLTQPGFFRTSFEAVAMPQDSPRMGFLSMNYFTEISPWLYGGVGSYEAVSGNQGGFFTLGLGGGVHTPVVNHMQADLGFYAGGGGRQSSLVGGGLMLKPYLGLSYLWRSTRFGLFYSYVNFSDGSIHSSQVGVSIDFLNQFDYFDSKYKNKTFSDLKEIIFPKDNYLVWQREDFSILLQGYQQLPGSRDLSGESQNNLIGLVGGELDHYINRYLFSWIRTDGAFSGINNGYMDILAGLGYKRLFLGKKEIYVLAQLGAGAGGGGHVDTGGGILLQPQVGLEWPLISGFGMRVCGGYLWAPDGHFQTTTATLDLLYHLDIARCDKKQNRSSSCVQAPYFIQAWRVQMFNQTYLAPQRVAANIDSAMNTFALQLDQLFTDYFLMSYQAASAYSGEHVGGYASGMLGPGFQFTFAQDDAIQIFGNFFLGAAGGGGLALGSGGVIEPVLGLRYRCHSMWGLQGSVGQMIAFHGGLSTAVFSVGVSVDLGLLRGKERSQDVSQVHGCRGNDFCYQ